MSTGAHTPRAREFSFGPFHLHATERRLLRQRRPYPLSPLEIMRLRLDLMGQVAAILRQLSPALAQMVELEREAYGLEAGPHDLSYDDLIAELQGVD
jgi:hypothetical protein